MTVVRAGRLVMPVGLRPVVVSLVAALMHGFCQLWPGNLSLVRYVQLVGWCRLPGTWVLDSSFSVGLIPMLLWSALVVRLCCTDNYCQQEQIAIKAAVSWPRWSPSALWRVQGCRSALWREQGCCSALPVEQGSQRWRLLPRRCLLRACQALTRLPMGLPAAAGYIRP